jgi:hypothetical protein
MQEENAIDCIGFENWCIGQTAGENPVRDSGRMQLFAGVVSGSFGIRVAGYSTRS